MNRTKPRTLALATMLGATLVLALAACAPALGAGGRVGAPTGAATLPIGFTEGTWSLRRAVRADATVLEPSDPRRYTLALLADGSAAIRADCNRGVGAYETSGERLTFGPFALTRALCPEGSLDAAFVALLADTVAYALERGALVLTTAGGDVLEFARAAD